MARQARERRSQTGVFLVKGLVLLSAVTLLSACAGGGSVAPDARSGIGGNRPEACRAGERIVASADACLQDEASCYILSDGNWCTGPREASCPKGSFALAAGAACPPGTRCFRISESLQCQVSF